MSAESYLSRGVSPTKDDVKAAVKNQSKGVFPGAFCKLIEDLAGDPEYCTAIHADGAGTKSSVAYLMYKETGSYDWFKGLAQDSLVMNTDDLACVGAINNLSLSNTIGRNAHLVDSLSGGRLGYVHIKSMGDESYRNVYSNILGKYNKKEGIVIDIRFNGGGRLHEDIEVLFSGKKYFTQVIRGREACDMPSRRWNKPSIMLMCEACYSNAHDTPWVYKHTGIGKLVGAPVAGTMTSVSWEDLQDDSMLFGIPIIGYQLPDGSYLENSQLEPDVLVLNDPSTVVLGKDTQLETAVSELLKHLKYLFTNK